MKNTNTRAMENEFTTPWGTITIHEDGSYFICPNFREPIWKWVEGSTVFEEDGRFGCIKDGTVVCPPIYDQIEFIDGGDTLYIRKGNEYSTFSRNGRNMMGNTIHEEDGEFVEKGKMGWRRNGEVLIPTIYDELYKWSGLDVFQAEVDGNVKFLNAAGEEILTYLRDVDAEDILAAPFSQLFNDGDIFTLLEYPAKKDIPSANVVNTDDGEKVSLDRVTRKELVAELVNPEDDLPLENGDLALFNNDFSYEYASYRFKVRAAHFYKDLMDCFSKFCVPSNSWHYVLRFSSAPGENVSAEELRELRHYFESSDTRCLGSHFAVGHDTTVEAGTVSVLVITHYHERCWPQQFEFEWTDNCNACNLDELKKKEEEMKKAIEDNVLDQYKEEVLRDQYDGAFVNVSFDGKRSWEEAKPVYEYLSQKTTYYMGQLRSYCFDLKQADTIEGMQYYLHFLNWILEKGASVNLVKNGSTALDVIENGIKHIAKKEMEAILKDAYELLESFGAKSYHQLLSEEKGMQPEYQEELERLRST